MLLKPLTVLDIETTGLHPKLDTLNFIGIHTFLHEQDEGTHTILYRPTGQELRDALPSNTDYVYHNGKFDTKFLIEKYDVELPITHDTMILAYLFEEVPHLLSNNKNKAFKRHALTLKACAMRELGVPDWDIDLETKTSDTPETREYLKLDLKYTRDLFFYYYKRFEQRELFTYKLILKTLEAYRYVELNGIFIEVDELDVTRQEFQAKHDEQQQLLFDNFAEINYGSPQQLANLLYVELELPCTHYTKKDKPSTSKEALADLLGLHPIIPEIQKLREYAKALTFLNDWEERHVDGRLYPTFNLHTTVTGRTSCTKPNIQQVPRLKALKKLFSAPEGSEFVQIDYSQVELRIAAIVADISEMKRAYRAGEDIHTNTGKKIAGKEEITKQERSHAKPVNFGFLYGMSYKTFPSYAKMNYGVVVTTQQAHAFRSEYFSLYPELLPFYEVTKMRLLAQGEVVNMFGRVYKVGPRALANWRDRGDYERRAINNQVQSAASDIALMAICEIHKQYYRHPEVKIVGTVHDSILFEIVRNENFETHLRNIKAIMENPPALAWALNHFGHPPFDIPIVADVEVGRWGSGEEIQL